MPAPLRLSVVLDRLEQAGLLRSAPDDDPRVSGITADSREVGGGALFCAWAGTGTDAHEYVSDAERAGAAAALVERRVAGSALPQAVVADGRRAAAVAAERVYGDPGAELTLAGVTGTNGKTTTVWLLGHLLAPAGPAAAIGTLGTMVIGEDGTRERFEAGAEPTTPGPTRLPRILRELVDRGVRAVALEVSSHALDQGRVAALGFDAAVFTNLSEEHLEYHGGIEAYTAAKRSLVGLLRPDGTAVVNAAEPAWEGLAREAPHALGFCLEEPTGEQSCDVRAAEIELGPRGTRFRLSAPGAGDARVELGLLGRFNVENALGAAAAVLALGSSPAEAADRLNGAPPVPGRLERVADAPCPVLVDYAHTPDALARVLETLRSIAPGRGRVIAVFGAGGERDTGKRPHMGAVARDFADVRIVTSDNPRGEDPEQIIDDVVAEMGEDYIREVDRRRAIARALSLARPDDIVLLAGKGHEMTQDLGTRTIPFDEREIVAELLNEEKFGASREEIDA